MISDELAVAIVDACMTVAINSAKLAEEAALAVSGLIKPEALYRILAAADRLTSLEGQIAGRQ